MGLTHSRVTGPCQLSLYLDGCAAPDQPRVHNPYTEMGCTIDDLTAQKHRHLSHLTYDNQDRQPLHQ
jgi:hypothetical protein